MANLTLDHGAHKILEKMARKKIRNALIRWEETKKEFEKDHSNPKLDFKIHHCMANTYKIKFLGANDGYRVLLLKKKDENSYHAFDILNHDSLDQK